jgi:hypothetical protein
LTLAKMCLTLSYSTSGYSLAFYCLYHCYHSLSCFRYCYLSRYLALSLSRSRSLSRSFSFLLRAYFPR